MNRLTPNEIQPAFSGGDDALITISFSDFLAAARRQLPLVLAGGIIGLALAVVYVLTATPLYESNARILLIDSTRPTDPTVVAVQATVANDIAVASQIELIKSLKVATLAVDNLQLQKDERVIAETLNAGGLFSEMYRWASRYARTLTTGETPAPEVDLSTDAARRDAAIDLVFDNLKVVRQPGTYVVDVSFETPYPELSAKVANAAADAYLEEQFTSSLDASVRASEWVSEQVGKLQEQASAASLAAEKFRTEKGLIEADGRLVVDKQLSDAVAQLSLSQNELSRARATLAQSETVLQSGNIQSILASIGNDETVSALRDRYTTALERVAAIAPQLGEEHDQVRRLRIELKQLGDQLIREFSRIVEANRNDVALKQSSVDGLTGQIADLRAAVSEANDNLVRLHELQRTADTLNNLHQTFLMRQQEAEQRGSYPVSQARVIQEAKVVDSPSSPKRVQALILALLGGIMAGAALGLFREVVDRSYRNGRQVAEDLDVPFLGYFPSMKDGTPMSPRAHGRELLSYVLAHPHSIAAATMRNLRVTVDMSNGAAGGKTIALTSALQSEGKTTCAANFARHLAQGGKRVLLIDVDFARPTLSKSYRKLPASLLDVMRGTTTIDKAVTADPKLPELQFVGLPSHQGGGNDVEQLSSEKLGVFLSDLRTSYDYIVLDTPPVGPVAETKLILGQVDAVILVVAWGATSRRTVTSIFEPLISGGTNVIGAVVTKARLGELKRYEHDDWRPEQYGYGARKAPRA